MGFYSTNKKKDDKKKSNMPKMFSNNLPPINVRISEDQLSAYLTLKNPKDVFPERGGYTMDEVMKEIEALGITAEVDTAKIGEMIEKGLYNSSRVIAEGIPSEDGIDGYFEYFFHRKDAESGKPRILDDGSVDYTSVNTVGTVTVGDLIALYHPAVPGKYGYSVTGEIIKPKEPKGMPVPALKGCHYDEETYSYYADIDGKVEATPTQIQVTATLEINRNINVAYGSIYFIGDVIVHGDVDSGVEITATGSVTIGGALQGSSIRAGDNISVNGGILGDDRTIITCGGNLESRFIQYANVAVGGDVLSRSILDSDIYAGGIVRVEDGSGVISGGVIYSTRGVDGQIVGNRRSGKTIISVGKSEEVLTKRFEYPKLIDQLATKLAGVNNREIQLEREAKINKSMANLLHLVRQNKARIIAEKKQLEAVYESLDALYGNNQVRPVIKGRKFFPGVIIKIDMREKRIDDEMLLVSFRGSDEGVSFSFDNNE